MAVVFNGENVGIAFPSEALTLITKEITENGTYNASNDGADGYSSVTVNVAGSGTNGLQWKCDNMKSLNREFAGYTGASIDEPFSGLDTSKVEDFGSCFLGCSNLTTIPQIDTSGASGQAGLMQIFQNCTKLLTIPALNTSNNIRFDYVFAGCSSLVEVPQLDTSMGTNFSYMFQSCHALTDWEIDLSSATNTAYMFNKSSGDRRFKNTSKLTNANYMFAQSSCENISGLNLSAVTSMNYFCNANKSIKSFIHPETANLVYLTSAFNNCTALETLELDLIKGSGYASFLSGCTNLKNLTLHNIKNGLSIASGTTWGNLLTIDSLVTTAKELFIMTGNYGITYGSANLEKIANVYVKLIDVTDEMIAEDPYITNKKPCVVCECTDEGPMLLAEKITSKGWKLS